MPVLVALCALITEVSEPPAAAADNLPSTPVHARSLSVKTGAAADPTAAAAAAGQRTLVSEVYGYGDAADGDGLVSILERHRHRYEVNPQYVSAIEQSGLYFTGRDDTGVRMEVAERARDDHPFFLGKTGRMAFIHAASERG